jgi:hypothetical protein
MFKLEFREFDSKAGWSGWMPLGKKEYPLHQSALSAAKRLSTSDFEVRAPHIYKSK